MPLKARRMRTLTTKILPAMYIRDPRQPLDVTAAASCALVMFECLKSGEKHGKVALTQRLEA